ncbi:MAG: AAA family ATPase [Conexivisphaera sp.]
MYLILDEVQLVRDWGRWVRRVSDSSKHRIYVTGSTSETTSREMVDAPRGRNVNHTLFPFSFREFLRTPGIATPDLRVFPYLEERGRILNTRYEAILYGDLNRRQYPRKACVWTTW